MKKMIVLAISATLTASAFADANYFSLAGGDFLQTWDNTGLITANDDWSGVPSVQGFLGDTNSGAPIDVDPRTWLDPNLGAIDVNANRTTLAGLEGIAELHLGSSDATVAMRGGATSDTPGLVFYMDGTGRTDILFSARLIDIDNSVSSTIQQFALQWRVGGTGDFTNIDYVNDATRGPSQSGFTSFLFGSDPAWDKQSQIEMRIITTNASFADEWVSVDAVEVTSVAAPEPASMVALGAGLAALVARRRRK